MPVDGGAGVTVEYTRPQARGWQGLIRKIFRNALPGMFMAYLVVLVAVCVMGPVRVTGFDPEATDYDRTYTPPSRDHIAGTDSLGRDLFARLIQGGRISLKIAFAAACISLVIGVTFGAISGFAGGKTDALMMRLVEVCYGVPTVLVVIMLMIWLEQGIVNILLAIGLTYWLNMARLVRGQVLALKHRDFVEAVRALGARPGRILVRHILPNTWSVILVALMLSIPEAIFMEAFLSYIGLGVPAPDASWGTLVADGASNLRSSPYLMLWPAGAICLTMLAFNVTGEWLSRGKAGRDGN